MSTQYPTPRIHTRTFGQNLSGPVTNPTGMDATAFRNEMNANQRQAEQRLDQMIGQDGLYPESRFHRQPGQTGHDSLRGPYGGEGWEAGGSD